MIAISRQLVYYKFVTNKNTKIKLLKRHPIKGSLFCLKKERTKKMEIINVTEKEVADELYKDCSLTLEGLAEEGCSDFLDWIKGYTALKEEKVYIIKGETMNSIYHLTDSNAYPDDLSIVCVKLADMENPMATALPRFAIKGRWFNDIVDNNERREKEKELRK